MYAIVPLNVKAITQTQEPAPMAQTQPAETQPDPFFLQKLCF